MAYYLPGSGVIPYGTRQGYNPIGSASPQYENQIDTIINPILQARLDASRQNQLGGVFNPAANTPWASPTILNRLTPYNQPVSGTGAPGSGASGIGNEFNTISNVKNPQIQSILDRVLGSTAKLNGQPNYTVTQSQKDAAQGSSIAGMRSRWDQTSGANQNALAKFTADYMGAQPRVNEFANQDTAAIGNVYSGEMQSNLNRLNRQRAIAVQQAMDRALGRARGSLNSQRLMFGDSSSLNSQYLNSLGDAMATAAKEGADIDRTNYLTVTDAQLANAGRRGQVLDASLNRGLVPIDAQSRLTGADMAALGQFGAATDQNNIYNLDTPESVYARQLALLGQGSAIDQSNVMYGVTKPYNPDASGMFVPSAYAPSAYPAPYADSYEPSLPMNYAGNVGSSMGVPGRWDRMDPNRTPRRIPSNYQPNYV